MALNRLGQKLTDLPPEVCRGFLHSKPEQQTGGRCDNSGLSGASNPNPRHNWYLMDRRRRVKHDLLDSRPPAHRVPRIVALPDPSAESRSFVKLEHVLSAMRVEE